MLLFLLFPAIKDLAQSPASLSVLVRNSQQLKDGTHPHSFSLSSSPRAIVCLSRVLEDISQNCRSLEGMKILRVW